MTELKPCMNDRCWQNTKRIDVYKDGCVSLWAYHKCTLKKFSEKPEVWQVKAWEMLEKRIIKENENLSEWTPIPSEYVLVWMKEIKKELKDENKMYKL